MNIAIIGTGYVGLPTGIGFANYGHNVICIDKDKSKIKQLQNGKLILFEKDLQENFDKVKNNNLKFSNNINDIKNAKLIIIAVGTPQDENGSANLQYIFEVANELKLNNNQIIAIKSTVPVGTNNKVKKILLNNNKNINFEIISMPEFLREGFAMEDFYNPSRIIIGTDNINLIKPIIEELYKFNIPIMKFTDIKSSELIKYASNAFLALKIHYINEIANLCEVIGANINEVADGMGLDDRIGKKFLHAGVGFGGSCFPKDTLAINYLAKQNNIDLSLINATIIGNNKRKIEMAKKIINKVKNIKNPIITFLGIAFKHGTDDCRESSSVIMIKYIQSQINTAKIRCYDALAINNAKKILNDVEFYNNIQLAIKNSDIIVIVNEDKEFEEIYIENIPIFDLRGNNKHKKDNVYKIGVSNFA